MRGQFSNVLVGVVFGGRWPYRWEVALQVGGGLWWEVALQVGGGLTIGGTTVLSKD